MTSCVWMIDCTDHNVLVFLFTLNNGLVFMLSQTNVLMFLLPLSVALMSQTNYVTCIIDLASVVCNNNNIRLVGVRNQLEGRVEVCLRGQWGTVCGDSWDLEMQELPADSLVSPQNVRDLHYLNMCNVVIACLLLYCNLKDKLQCAI